MTHVAAFFDFDGTMISENSGMLWIRHERRKARISLHQVGLGMLYMALYRIRALDMDKALGQALVTIKNRSESDLADEVREWYFSDVRQHTLPEAGAAIKAHRERGDRLVLLTSASKYESEAVVEDFGLDDYLCTLYEVKDGRFTGEAIKPLCYGKGKVTLAERFAASNDIDLDKSYFYSDSCTDLPMLERVGHPRIVRPDFRLRRTARRRKWPILDW